MSWVVGVKSIDSSATYRNTNFTTDQDDPRVLHQALLSLQQMPFCYEERF